MNKEVDNMYVCACRTTYNIFISVVTVGFGCCIYIYYMYFISNITNYVITVAISTSSSKYFFKKIITL